MYIYLGFKSILYMLESYCQRWVLYIMVCMFVCMYVCARVCVRVPCTRLVACSNVFVPNCELYSNKVLVKR